MYIIVLIIFIVAITLSFTPSPLIFINMPSLVIVLSIVIVSLWGSGLFSAFSRAHKIVMSKKSSFPSKDLKESLIAINLVIKACILAGIFGALTGCMSLLANLTELSGIGPALAIALLTILYGVIGIIFLLPMKAKIQRFLLSSE